MDIGGKQQLSLSTQDDNQYIETNIIWVAIANAILLKKSKKQNYTIDELNDLFKIYILDKNDKNKRQFENSKHNIISFISQDKLYNLQTIVNKDTQYIRYIVQLLVDKLELELVLSNDLYTISFINNIISNFVL